METKETPAYKDPLFITGLLMIIISLSVFVLTDNNNKSFRDADMGVFTMNYLLCILYFFILLLAGRFRFWKINGNPSEFWMLFFILGLISAYSLNREMGLFDDSTDWLSFSLCLQCVVIILLTMRKVLPVYMQYLLYLLAGAGFVLFAYLAFYLLPTYPVGLLGAIILGITLHLFVPLAICISTMRYIVLSFGENPYFKYFYVTGMALPLLFFTYFFIQWQGIKSQMHYSENEGIMNEESGLPNWIYASQHIKHNWISERYLKADLVYSVPDHYGFSLFGGRSRGFGEAKHDPLVMTAAFLSGKTNIDEKTRIKVLESQYDARHHTQERLWSGDKLSTSNIISQIKIFPEYRMAYTEKTLSIQSETSREFDQEAIYTFHLPEGGVVTSLSLWVNGVEEKGILTSKSKADSAYKTIVGVQKRDPSVIHWQEGNRVSVRVFPCNSRENRRFKIGITSPLQLEGEKLIYENISFEGPPSDKADESLQLLFTQKPAELDKPSVFTEKTERTFVRNGTYRSDWKLKFDKPALTATSFSFNNATYNLQEFKPELENFSAEKIYLDINSSWSEYEIRQIWEQVKDRKVYVWDGTLTQLTKDNVFDLFDDLSTRNFSLFPLQYISEPDRSLLISKSNVISPGLQDIKGSSFGDSLTSWLKTGNKVRHFNLGTDLSPYLKTLKELRVFNYADGDVSQLKQLMSDKKFPAPAESDSSVVIDNASLRISRSEGETKGNAPDHLQRLFAYNHIMQQVSKNYFNSDYITEPILQEAEQAYVVSPVTSLIVLETQADYERFDIKESDNSLKNASLKSSGSVPEPHEWMLIFLTGCTVIYMLFKQYIPKFIRVR